jgi:toxin-antitoxin system PIN domain toxin
MNLCDPYVWLAMVLPAHQDHKVARNWWENLSPEKGLFCRGSQQVFLRLLTTADVLKPYDLPARTHLEAWKIYHQLMSDPCSGFLDEPEGIEEMWITLSSRENSSPKLWLDTYLAALAIKSSCPLVTFDESFRQFEAQGLCLKYLGDIRGIS